MKQVFALSFLALLALTGLVWTFRPPVPSSDKTPLVWTSDDNPLRKEQVELFNRLHPKLSLQLDPNNEGIEKVIVQSLSGVGPDLLDCRDAGQLAAYVKAGIAWDVTEELASRGIDVSKESWKYMVPQAILDGRVYGVPTNAAANAIWINEDLFAKAGIPIPTHPMTWDQFGELAQKLTLRDATGRPTQFGFLMDWWNTDHFIYSFGGRYYTPDGTVCTLDSPACITAIQTMQDMVYKYKVTPSPVEESSMQSAGGWGSGTINIFGAGRAATALGGRWWLANIRDFKGLHLAVIESPFGTVRACSGAGRVTLINSHSKHRKEALEFLLYLASKPYGDLINSQADGIAPFKSQCTSPEFFHDPKHPEERYNAVWAAVTDETVPAQSSPYVNSELVRRIVQKEVDLVKANEKTPAEAMKAAALEVNTQIKNKLAEDPKLRAQWESATGRKA